MRSLAVLVLLLGFATGCGSATAPFAAQRGSSKDARDLIPRRVQSRIEKSYPSLAFAPAWLPASYRYGGYFPQGKWFIVSYSSSQYPDALSWSVAKTPCDTTRWRRANTPMLTFRMNHVTVYWGGTNSNQQAQRCVKRRGGTLLFTADASVAENHPYFTPKQRHDAFVLAKAVAYAKPLG